MSQQQSLVSAETPEEPADVVDEQVRRVHRGKVTAAIGASPLHRDLRYPQLLKVDVGDDENDEEPERVEDEQDAPTRVADGEVRDAGRDQGDAESEGGELLYLGRDARD